MDSNKKAGKWSWLPVMMPGVAQKIVERRKAYGNAHVDLCWRKGVIEGEPGWFFAREGALAVGTIDGRDEQMRAFVLQRLANGMCAIYMREPESAGGGHGA